ncbi:LuxR C-terminal-related transcriptional regulator [Microbacterium sp. 18062]|uniref:LuxR C-terminal-related transcriptional regulator n=1 Tax=Microbacterium sp. 18062 TaxID=2681410 RepID=UPI0035A0EE92
MVHPGLTNEQQLVSRAVQELTRRTRFPVAFGGLVEDHSVRVTSIVGARSRSIEGLVVREQRGLGGRALLERRPRLALDYRTARGITHDYDRAILGEGIATLFAVPVVAAGRTLAMVYCGSWSESAVDDAVARPALRIAEQLSAELRIREEVARRVALAEPVTQDPGLDAAAREEVRESFAELRSIAASVADAELRARLAHVEERLAAVARGAAAPEDVDVQLSPREVDVLACAALGSTNAEIAVDLALKETTVKSYLAAAMAKLDASTRHAAVAKARRAGLLP